MIPRPIRLIALVTLTSLLLTGFAYADDCHVTESGVPENAIVPVDVVGIRTSLATDGIALGGSYLAELELGLAIYCRL
jgi:hypothetical protein